MTIRERMRGTVSLLSQWGLASGRDVVATTRDSFVSMEGRAGVTVFVLLWVLGRWQAGPWTVWGPELGGEIVSQVRVKYAFWVVGTQLLLLGCHILLGAAWGIVAKNAGGLIARWRPPLSVHRLKPWIGSVLSGGTILGAHAIVLVRDMARHPALYQETFLDRGGWAAGVQQAAVHSHWAPWVAVGTGLVVVWVALAALELGIRFYHWWMGFPRPTRLASTVLGGTVMVFAVGVLGVRWVQAQRNDGPNLLLISIDGWRAPTSETTDDVAHLKKNGRGPLVRVGTVAPSVDLSPTLATALSGLSPMSNGIRHDFVAVNDGLRGAETLSALLSKNGWTTVLMADGPSGMLDRLANGFDQRWMASSHALARTGRRMVERSPQVLPYLSGRWGRRLGLRGSVLTADPAVLADETNSVLGDLKNRPRFFLWVHFSSPGSSCAVVSPRAARRLALAANPFFRRPGRGFDPHPLAEQEENALRRLYGESLRETYSAVRKIFESLARRGMDASTAVVLWSPRAALLSSDEMERAQRLEGPAFDGLPFWAWEGPYPVPVSTRSALGRAVDVAPTAVQLLGLEAPIQWEGVSLTGPSASGEAEGILIESNDPNQKTAQAMGLPSRWEALIEDRDWPGRFCRNPAWEDPLLIFRDRVFRLGSERVSYRPGTLGVEWAFECLQTDRTGSSWARARAYKDRTKELKEIFFRAMARHSDWRPQNDYWIPESFLREEAEPFESDVVRRMRIPRFWTDSK